MCSGANSERPLGDPAIKMITSVCSSRHELFSSLISHWTLLAILLFAVNTECGTPIARSAIETWSAASPQMHEESNYGSVLRICPISQQDGMRLESTSHTSRWLNNRTFRVPHSSTVELQILSRDSGHRYTAHKRRWSRVVRQREGCTCAGFGLYSQYEFPSSSETRLAHYLHFGGVELDPASPTLTSLRVD